MLTSVAWARVAEKSVRSTKVVVNHKQRTFAFPFEEVNDWNHAGTRGTRCLALRSKNKAWLAMADTIAGWKGFEIRKAGSGRSPVKNRSGYAVMKTTGASNESKSSLTASSPELPSAN